MEECYLCAARSSRGGIERHARCTGRLGKHCTEYCCERRGGNRRTARPESQRQLFQRALTLLAQVGFRFAEGRRDVAQTAAFIESHSHDPLVVAGKGAQRVVKVRQGIAQRGGLTVIRGGAQVNGVGIHVSAAGGFTAQGAGRLAPRTMMEPWRERGLRRDVPRLRRQPCKNRLRNLIRQRAVARAPLRQPLHKTEILRHQRAE